MRKTNLSAALTAAAGFALALHGSTAPAQQFAVTAPQKEAAPALSAPPPQHPLSVQEETFSLPAKEAVALLREVRDDGERYDRLVALATQGKARLERLIVLRTMSGQRAVSESIDELRYPTEFGPASFGTPKTDSQGKPRQAQPTDPEIVHKDIIAASGLTPTSFETRNVGDTLEIEPEVQSDGKTILINIVPQYVSYKGEQEIKGPNPVYQPIFEAQKLTTSASLTNGRPFLLGTLNPPANDGLGQDQAERQVWLDFLTCQVLTDERPAQARSVPVLGAIPVAGALFRIPEKTAPKSE